MNKVGQKGGSLVELMVVISIIAVLSISSFKTIAISREKARDTQRKQHITEIANALVAWGIDNGSDAGMDGSGCGAAGVGVGWFESNYGGGAGSIRNCLIVGGYISADVIDPRYNDLDHLNKRYRYMKYDCDGKVYLFANLERKKDPAPEVVSCSVYDTTYGMDYVVEVR